MDMTQKGEPGETRRWVFLLLGNLKPKKCLQWRVRYETTTKCFIGSAATFSLFSLQVVRHLLRSSKYCLFSRVALVGYICMFCSVAAMSLGAHVRPCVLKSLKRTLLCCSCSLNPKCCIKSLYSHTWRSSWEKSQFSFICIFSSSIVMTLLLLLSIYRHHVISHGTPIKNQWTRSRHRWPWATVKVSPLISHCSS